MTRSEALIVLKRINYHAEYEEYDAITDAIRCVELHDELIDALDSFLQDGYDHHYCKHILKKAKEVDNDEE